MGELQRRLAIAGFHDRSARRSTSCWRRSSWPIVLVRSCRCSVWAGARLLCAHCWARSSATSLPGLVLDRRIAQRQKEIQNGLPDALDLLIVCLEAGLGARPGDPQGRRGARPSRTRRWPRSCGSINVECRAGKPRLEAFKNFATRTKVDDVRALVAMLVQTDRFGTSVAQALRTHAEVSRTKRRQRAEERAAKIGVKLVFPLVFCLFPAFYVVTLGPAIIKFMHAFSLRGPIGGF